MMIRKADGSLMMPPRAGARLAQTGGPSGVYGLRPRSPCAQWRTRPPSREGSSSFGLLGTKGGLGGPVSRMRCRTLRGESIVQGSKISHLACVIKKLAVDINDTSSATRPASFWSIA